MAEDGQGLPACGPGWGTNQCSPSSSLGPSGAGSEEEFHGWQSGARLDAEQASHLGTLTGVHNVFRLSSFSPTILSAFQDTPFHLPVTSILWPWQTQRNTSLILAKLILIGTIIKGNWNAPETYLET